MVILAIDTSHRVGSVTLRLDERTSETREFGAESSHLVELAQSVIELTAAAGVDLSDLDRVAVVLGPGSFTGLRIGMAYAKGIHAALGVGLVAMSSLDLLAVEGLMTAEVVCTMIDARRDEVYAALYRRGAPWPGSGGRPLFRPLCEIPPQATAPETFLLSTQKRPMVFVGSGAERWRETIAGSMGAAAGIAGRPVRPSSEILARLAAWLPVIDASRVSDLEPLYIRPSDAKLKPLKRVRTHE